MAENLKTTKYNDGTAIPLVTDNPAWDALTSPAFCYYNNDGSIFKDTYGIIYNWHAVNTGKLCPKDWYIPSDAEWTILTDFLGGESVAGGKLKETGVIHWSSPNSGATNETGFTALPGGSRYFLDGSFSNVGKFGYWWSSSEHSTTTAWLRYIYCSDSIVHRYDYSKRYGLSVRCIRN
jgi:uncharacterized protein (TIGR02145 family)